MTNETNTELLPGIASNLRCLEDFIVKTFGKRAVKTASTDTTFSMVVDNHLTVSIEAEYDEDDSLEPFVVHVKTSTNPKTIPSIRATFRDKLSFVCSSDAQSRLEDKFKEYERSLL